MRVVSRSSGFEGLQVRWVLVQLDPVVHGVVLAMPTTFGMIENDMEQLGISFFEPLKVGLREAMGGDNPVRRRGDACLLVVRTPIVRVAGGAVERHDVRAYVVFNDFVDVCVGAGLLEQIDGEFWNVPIVGDSDGGGQGLTWRSTPVVPAKTYFCLDETDARRQSGLDASLPPFNGVLAGVGALGSAVADLWGRSGWGVWTFVDPDLVKPHNVARHLARDGVIGHPKATVVRHILDSTFESTHLGDALTVSASRLDDSSVAAAVDAADLLVDMTTTLSVPRDWSKEDNLPRATSGFLTPSGRGSVLLVEDGEREFRLIDLESQYYSAIVNSEWGSSHLDGSLGQYWVGGGCREVTTAIPVSAVAMHAGVLAREIRESVCVAAPRISIWEEEGDQPLVHRRLPVSDCVRHVIDKWTVVWTTDIEARLRALRESRLPNETGGVLLGFLDQALLSIHVVAALPAPTDSDEDPHGFTRGVRGLENSVREAGRRTGEVVGYLGEWHSHPPNIPAEPSFTDLMQFTSLASDLDRDGYPALCMIVGAGGSVRSFLTRRIADDSWAVARGVPK